MIALAAGMGLGRFLYTPVLPIMSEATGLAPASAGAIAGANFAGYLAGALLASLPGMSAHARLWLMLGLVSSAATGALMGLTQSVWLWGLLRLVSGMASAFILIFASALVTSALRAAGRPGLGVVHFAGVGAGIAISAVIASPPVVSDEGWRAIWWIGAGLTVLALLVVTLCLPARPAAAGDGAASAGPRPGLWRLIAAYGCLGFGYVITATFIVQILREGGAGRVEEAWVWGIVGLCAIPSVAFWSAVAGRIGTIRAYQIAMLIEAVGVTLSIFETGAAMLTAAILLGGTFMGLTALGFQEATRRVGGDGRAIMALMTASFGVGQMTGPLLAGWLRDTTGSFVAPSLIAAFVLVAGATLLIRMPPAKPA
ncbi:MAG: YbfB/YjiJ family MFS transporter [Pseudomonadota bacterium]